MNKGGSKQWVFLFRFGGRPREMGLGGISAASLAEARKAAEVCRAKVAWGINPIEARQAELFVPTFGECSDEFCSEMSRQWRSENGSNGSDRSANLLAALDAAALSRVSKLLRRR